MVTAISVFGGLLSFTGIAIILNALKTQLIAFGVGSAIGVPSFITDFLTPDVSSGQIFEVGIGGLLFFIGLVVVVAGRRKTQF